MKDDLAKVLDNYLPLYELGINSDPLLYAILEMLDEEAKDSYEEGYIDGWTDKAESFAKENYIPVQPLLNA